jgi:hypothetical protein
VVGFSEIKRRVTANSKQYTSVVLMVAAIDRLEQTSDPPQLAVAI